MKEKIHPQYQEVTVHCSCGATWKTGSTMKELRLEICSNCHPFFTGTQRFVDTTGRVERFKAKLETQKKAAEAEATKKTKKAAKAATAEAKAE